MIEKEQVIDWLEHPVTQLYRSIIKSVIDDRKDITMLNVTTLDAETIASNTVATVNYVQGLQDAIAFESVFSEEIRDD